jgi:hypothetical protein
LYACKKGFALLIGEVGIGVEVLAASFFFLCIQTVKVKSEDKCLSMNGLDLKFNLS